MTSKKIKTRPQEFWRVKNGKRYTGVALLESASDAQRVSRVLRRELDLSVMAIQPDRGRGLFPIWVLYIPDDKIGECKKTIIDLIENEVEAYFDGSETERQLEVLKFKTESGGETDRRTPSRPSER